MEIYQGNKLLSSGGKSPVAYAKDAGYTGTDDNFYTALANMPNHLSNQENPHGVTAVQIGAVSATKDGTVSSNNTDYAEVDKWADGNTSDEDRIGYFVAINTTAEGMAIVKATSTADIHGVTVASPAFASGYSADKVGTDGNLLAQYDYVAIMGIAPVIDNGTCTVNGRCMPGNDGTAIPSTNNFGYHVISRVDSTHVLIAVEPGADMMQRVKTDITDLQNNKVDASYVTNAITEAIGNAIGGEY